MENAYLSVRLMVRLSLQVSWMFGRGTRVELDIKAGNPVILVPRSAKSSRMLVADLGNLTVANGFLWEGSPGTVAHSKNRQRSQSQPDSGRSCEWNHFTPRLSILTL